MCVCGRLVLTLSYENREPGKLDMSAHLKVNDFTHKKLINDIKDFFGSVGDWHSRERRRSKALSAQRYFCGFFLFISVWRTDLVL